MKKLNVKIGLLLSAIIVLALVFKACEPQPKAVKTVDISHKILNRDLAKRMSAKFSRDMQELMPDTNAQDTMAVRGPRFKVITSSWFSIEELESYIALSKHEADSLGVDFSGYNIYFGIFPDKEEKEGLRNSLTIFFSPTKGKPDIQEGSFFPVTSPPVQENVSNMSLLEYGIKGNQNFE